ncbi:hypothetical protein AVEN_210886-1 [Araneus ventricosus]|uniref:CUB domain-containing protein n=1 Tax=Araneus ventricosus TaxID=182803 RepID=A0A4Y2KFT5_ARAVE|nr:hypothetical protein AVEN_210886-1 [Araneus ventricosus]
MEGIKIVAFAFILCGFQLYNVECQSCKIEKKLTGTIVAGGNTYSKQECWTIPVPLGNFIHLQLKSMHQSGLSCQQDYVRINIAGTSDLYTFCSSDSNKNPIIAFDNVTVTHSVSTSYSRYTGFTLEYTIRTTECPTTSARFKCDGNHACPRKSLR